jgi:hypothetical protein
MFDGYPLGIWRGGGNEKGGGAFQKVKCHVKTNKKYNGNF